MNFKPSRGPASPAENNSKVFTSRSLATQAKDARIPEWSLTVWATLNGLADSDATAHHVTALYNSSSQIRIVSESSRSSWANPRARANCPHCDVEAVPEPEEPGRVSAVKKAERLHPAIGLTLEGVAPRDGATICGQFSEQGTIVSMNPLSDPPQQGYSRHGCRRMESRSLVGQ